MKSAKELFKEFLSIPGVTGMESAVAEKFISEAKDYSDEVYIDNIGNAVALKKGDGKRKVLAAGHIDEIGMMVTKIEKGGYLKITQVGGVDPSILLGQEVTIHAENLEIYGVIGSKPPHFLSAEERSLPINWDLLYVDTGLSEMKVADNIKVGNFVSFRSETKELLNGKISGKSIDDRYGAIALILTLQRLSKMKPSWDFYAVGTVQEEWSGIGANSATYKINPDIAIAIDVTHGNLPGLSDKETFNLGKGVTLSVGPNIHPGILSKAKKICTSEEIPYKLEVAPYGTGTDAYTMQIVRSGIPSLVISAPVRSMHSPVETIDIKDVERTSRLLSHLICNFEEEDLDIDIKEKKE